MKKEQTGIVLFGGEFKIIRKGKIDVPSVLGLEYIDIDYKKPYRFRIHASRNSEFTVSDLEIIVRELQETIESFRENKTPDEFLK